MQQVVEWLAASRWATPDMQQSTNILKTSISKKHIISGYVVCDKTLFAGVWLCRC